MENRIRELRQERIKLAPRAFTAASVAGRLGVTENTLLRWERGQAQPRKRHAQALAQELGVSVADLALEQERQVWREREGKLAELADHVSVSNVEETKARP